jgi:hypothetical protein
MRNIVLITAACRRGELIRLIKHAQGAVREQKKARRPFGCGLNPIQGELEETGIIILLRNNFVLFIVVMSDIHQNNNLTQNKSPPDIHRAGFCVSYPELDLFCDEILPCFI